MQGEKNLSSLPKLMSKNSNFLNFDKEVASSIGLNESVVLQQIKVSSKPSLINLKNDLPFLEEKELNRILKKLLNLKLITEAENKTFSVKSKKEVSKPERKNSISENFVPSKNTLKEARVPVSYTHLTLPTKRIV